MKRTFKSFFVSALLVLVCLTLVACVDQNENVNNNDIVTVPFGGKYPEKITTAHKINSSMSAIEMYEAGVQNFYEASFSAARQLGNITTSSALDKDMLQKLDCFRIKQDDIYYLDSRSFTVKGSPNIQMCDQSIYYPDGYQVGGTNYKYFVRSAEKSGITVDKTAAKLTVNKWPEIEKFKTLRSGLQNYPDDLTKMNMFIVNKDTINANMSTKPVYDAKNKTYKFTLNMDVNTDSIKNYIPVMEYKTLKGGGFPADSIKFHRLKLTVEMWDNGLIKSIDNEESYDIVAKVLGIKTTSKTTLFSTTYFTYDRTEVNINDYLFAIPSAK